MDIVWMHNQRGELICLCIIPLYKIRANYKTVVYKIDNVVILLPQDDVIYQPPMQDVEDRTYSSITLADVPK